MLSMLENKNILVCGCGGLGTEILKILKFFKVKVTVIDKDDVSLSNLNRQYFYRREDIGKNKVECIKKKFCKMKNFYLENAIHKDIFDLKKEDIEKYDIIILCLDNVESRMHVNYLISLIEKNIILLDIGVEGVVGHVKICDKSKSCLYCIKDLYRQEKTYNICSLKTLNHKKYNREDYLAMELSNNKKKCKIDNCKCYIEKTMINYNSLNGIKETTIFELEGIDKNIISNVCYINSILASLAILKLSKYYDNKKEKDFINYSGKNIEIIEIEICKDTECFLCYK
ncbi:Ubiquitin-activating enzyme E1 [Spraguea lophii 42_110]|uniref:NEDD8-activating enzyme E1 catalytic subunit n=1 Tax=Spraguea lophii (strain 42_110) TaxID=1358809 RepID=S7W5N4_SPRLO|nr:Ubiquitin-activating enzyme E1 [Spraguea lophii 42_110]